MKLKNILYTGVALMSLTACNDYLDVDAPSAYTMDFVFSQETEISRALNGVYAQALKGDLYGNAYQGTFILNSDVDIKISSNSAHAHNTYSRFDCDDQGGDITKFWTAAYSLIENANKFIQATEASPIYKDENGKYNMTLQQWIGEAKCLRAMAYHDLVVMFGDVPFTMEPSSVHGADYVVPVADRQVIQDSLIADLKRASLTMKYASSVTVERCSKEFAQGMIARIALTAGGYSLRPNKADAKSYGEMKRPDNYIEYYKIARDYADSVISSNTHSLHLGFQEVFVNECNYNVVNNDDPIFELPFAKESTGNTGYSQGPTYSDYEGKTVGPWGKCDGGTRLNAFYRFLFRNKDVRREQVNGLWYYSYYTKEDGTLADSVYIRSDYSVHNNKWSKLWTSEGSALGSDKSGSTGINYPYMRYADILLMFAEADNEIEGAPSQTAKDRVKEVHKRAFPTVADGDVAYIDAATTKEEFHKIVMDERKWEFAGENSRWRDLVRTNTYSQELVYSFLRYYSAAIQNTGTVSGFEDAITAHDGSDYIDKLPSTVYYHTYDASVVTPVRMISAGTQFYGYTVAGTGTNRYFSLLYPNQSLKSLRIYNAYEAKAKPKTSAIGTEFPAWTIWLDKTFYEWGDQNTGTPKDQCKYSFYGFIRCDDNGNIRVVNNGAQEQLPSDIDDASQLPVVRYILPYPNSVLQRSAGIYKNYYGY